MPDSRRSGTLKHAKNTRLPSGDAIVPIEPTIKARWKDDLQTWTYLPSRSPVMRDVEHRAIRLASSEESILILGETGTGKDLMARLIHENSTRRGKSFIHVNCAALSESLLESELFGHVRGAYTGATDGQHGLFEAANGGTIFLDEIGELPPKLQAKLLHVLQERRLFRVGGRKSIKIDIRVLAATNCNLKQAMKTGAFRRDLFYRLGVVSLHIPSLRERIEDLQPLVEFLFRRLAELYNRPDLDGPDEGFLDAIRSWSWPGNIRELENVVKRAILLQEMDRPISENHFDSAHIEATSLSGDVDVDEGDSAEYEQSSLRELSQRAQKVAERRAILRVLNQHGWNRRKVARALQVSYRSLLYKIKEYGMTQDAPARPLDH